MIERQGREAPFIHHEALAKVIAATAPLIIVAAPAGYGKSTLVAAIARYYRDLGWTISASDDGKAFAQAVCDLQDRKLLVLEDAHQYDSGFLLDLAKAAHTKSPGRSIIATRRLPRANWTGLQADGAAILVNVEDLRLDLDKTRSFIEAKGCLPSAEDVRAAHDYTSGCVRGVSSISETFAARGRLTPASLTHACAPLARVITADLPADLIALLADAAVLDVLSYDLVENVLGSAAVAAFLQGRDEFMLLERSPDGHDFRRLPAFLRDEIRDEHPIAGDRRTRLLADTGAWLRREGRVDLAITHLLEARRPNEAAALLEVEGPRLLTQKGDNPRILAWLDRVVDLGGTLTPRLRLWRVWALAYSLRLDEAESELAAVQPHIKSDCKSDVAFAERLAVSIFARRGRVDDVERLGEDWMRRWGDREPVQAAGVSLLLSLVAAYRNNPRAERRMLLLARQYAVESGNDAASLWVLGVEALTELHAGRAVFAADIIERAQAVAERLGGVESPVSKMLSVIAAVIHLELDNLDTVGKLLSHGYDSTRSYGLIETHLAAQEAMVGYSEQIRGANDALLNAHQEGIGGRRYMLSGHLLSIGVLLRAGRVREARQRYDAVRDTFADADPHSARELQNVEAAVEYAEGNPSRTIELIKPLLSFADANGQRRRFTSLLLMRAAAEFALGETRAARQCLSRAIGVASAGQLLRTVLERGPAIRELLLHVVQEQERDVSQVADRFLGTVCTRLGIDAGALSETQISVAPLTDRERQILELLDSGLRTAELATRLDIGITTAKWHIQSIFRKLGVRNRSGAVAAARRLCII